MGRKNRHYGYVNRVDESDNWITPNESNYVTDGKCPHTKSDMVLIISNDVRKAFRYLHKKLPGLEWALYLLGERGDGEESNVIKITGYVMKPQKSSGAHVVFVRDGMDTSYRDDVKKEYPDKIVGNVHSHNNMGVFPSGEDQDVMLVDGEFALIVNAREEVRGWTHFKLPCGSWVLSEVKVYYEDEVDDTVPEGIDLSLREDEYTYTAPEPYKYNNYNGYTVPHTVNEYEPEKRKAKDEPLDTSWWSHEDRWDT